MEYNVNDLSLLEKISALRECVNKAKVGYRNLQSPEGEYYSQVTGNLQRDSVMLDNATKLFIQGTINSMDSEKKWETEQLYNQRLGEILTHYPGYYKADEEEQARGSR